MAYIVTCQQKYHKAEYLLRDFVQLNSFIPVPPGRLTVQMKVFERGRKQQISCKVRSHERYFYS